MRAEVAQPPAPVFGHQLERVGMMELACRPHRPVRVCQRGPAQHDDVDQFLADDAVGHARQAQVPAGGHRDTDLTPHAGGALDHEGHVGKRHHVHVVGVEAQAQVGQIEPVVLHHPDSHHRVVELHARRVQVVGAQAHRQRQALGPDLAHGVERFKVKAQAVFQASAVFVGALVGQRREETCAEVAVCEMHFQPLEAGVQRPHRGLCIAAVDVLDLGLRHGVHRVRVLAAVGDGRRTRDLPAVRMIRGQLRAALPGLEFAALAPGVAQLDAGHAAHVLDDFRDARQAFDLRVVVDAAAAHAGAPVDRDRQLLGKHQAEAAGGARAQQHHVKVVHQPVSRPVHRHRRHGDAVAKRHAFERVGAKQMRHASTPVDRVNTFQR